MHDFALHMFSFSVVFYETQIEGGFMHNYLIAHSMGNCFSNFKMNNIKDFGNKVKNVYILAYFAFNHKLFLHQMKDHIFMIQNGTVVSIVLLFF